MAVRIETTIKRFTALSTDTKPVVGTDVNGVELTANDLPTGSVLYERDAVTGEVRVFRWDGYGWNAPSDDREVPELLGAMLGELTAIRERLEMVAGD